MPEEVLERARVAFTAYRAALADIRSDPYDGALPRDPTYLSWTLAASRRCRCPSGRRCSRPRTPPSG